MEYSETLLNASVVNVKRSSYWQDFAYSTNVKTRI